MPHTKRKVSYSKDPDIAHEVWVFQIMLLHYKHMCFRGRFHAPLQGEGATQIVLADVQYRHLIPAPVDRMSVIA